MEEAPEDLARQAAAGRLEAFESLVARFEAPLYRFLVLRTRSRHEAEDLTQATLVRAWERIRSWDSGRHFAPWLFTIAARLASSQARRAARSSAEPLDEPAGHEPDPLAACAARERDANLWVLAARHLAPQALDVLWLRYVEGLLPGEIARVLERPPGSVRVTLFRARRTLARHLAEPVGPVRLATFPLCYPALADAPPRGGR